MLLIKGLYSQRCRREQRTFATRCRYDAVQLILPTGHIIPCTEYAESNLYFTQERSLCWLIFSGLVYESSRGSNLHNKMWRWVTSDLYYCPVMCHHFSFSSPPLPPPCHCTGCPLCPLPTRAHWTGSKPALVHTKPGRTPQLHHVPARSIPPHTNTNPPPGTRVRGSHINSSCWVPDRRTTRINPGNTRTPASPHQRILHPEPLRSFNGKGKKPP